jgi:serine/threonine-protein kinase
VFGRRKLEWVANYRDPRNYLLFSLDADGLEIFTVEDGKREAHGPRLIVPKVNYYTFLVQVQSARITTSMQDGAVWKVLSDWNNLPRDVDRGKFGFKDQATIYNFGFTYNK